MPDYHCEMASRRNKAYLYITEWMEVRDLTDEAIANQLGLSRETIWKWRNQQHRLTPQKILDLAGVLNVRPEQLWYPPSHANVPSLDELIIGASDELRRTATDIVKRLVER